MTMPSPNPTPGSGPQGPFTPPPAEPASQSSSRRNLLLAGILGGVGCLFVLLVVVALVIFFVVRGGGGAGGGGGTEEDTASDLSPEEQATALVTDYMDALQAGDAATALELMPVQEEADSVVLPVEAYTTALELAPVADVEIGAPTVSGLSGDVTASFTVGGTAVSHDFSVTDYDDDGTFELTPTLGTTSVPDSVAGLGATLNGAEITPGQLLYLMPGGYELAYGVEHFEPSSGDPMVLAEQYGSVDWPDAQLTEEGQEVFREAVNAAVQDCLAATTLEGGCGMGSVPETSTDGWTMVEDTVERTLPEDTQRTIDTMEGTPSYDEPTYVEGSSVGSVTTEITCTKDGQEGICELFLGGGMSTPYVDMADPELPVTWS